MRIFSRIRILIDRIRFSFPIKKEAGKVAVRLHEKHRPLIKWIKYILAAVGLLSSLLPFATIFESFLVSVGLFILGWVIEKVGFRFTTLYVTPIQEKKIDLEQWTGVGFGFAGTPGTDDNIPLVSFVFSSLEAARTVHELLLKWSHGETQDKEKQIGLTIVVNEKEELYYCLLFPGLDRPGIREVAESMEKQKRSSKETFDDQHDQMILLQSVRKCLKLQKQSYLHTFRKRLPANCPVLLTFSLDSHGLANPVPIEELVNLIVFSLRIVDEKDLKNGEIEYKFMKMA